ncbi:AAA family ATPase, partial [Candidatus Bipolaricaulota bacterium]|nr:AAA family ATPase [Candidatus Bipolaricaulota bacterium]
MSVERLAAYLPVDRRRAIASGKGLADRTVGSVLLADISGFTPLTEALVAGLGPRRGADELTKLLNTVYTALVSRVHHFGGSVICFIGDALISCFLDDSGLRALSCGLQMQRTMRQFQAFPAPHGGRVSLAMKAAVAAGPMRRFLIGNPAIQRMDVLAGATVDRLTEAEHLAERGEVIASPEVARKLFSRLLLSKWRGTHGVVEGLRENVVPTPWPDLAYAGLTAQALGPYLLSPVHERVTAGQGEFLAELRPVSVLFLQFGGIDYDDDDAGGEKLDVYTRWVQGVANRYGGYVLLLTTADKGSHLYVVYGALEAHEDDRQRAVATALRLQEPPSELGFITGVRIGVSYGRARVGAYGGESRRTYGALGDAVNLAARLMQAAPCGEIRCSESIYEASRDRWSFDVLPAVELKGMERPQPVYRPHPRERTNVVRDGRALIGRREELEDVRRSMREALGGTRRGLLIEGEAGIGKSRLVEEVRRIAGEAGFTCLFGATDSIEQHAAYRVWRGILLDLLRISDSGGDPVELRARVVERVTALGPATAARAPLLNDILMLGIPESPLTRSYEPGVRQDSLAALVGELMRQAASRGPLVLIIEDAHWLDSLSWELLVSVARALANRPALLVLTHRPFPEPIPTEFSTLRGMGGVEPMLLGSLSPDDTLELAAVRLGLTATALPEAVVGLLADRAEGNPFYATELIGALLDQGLLAMDGASCRVTVDATALRKSVPDTLEGVVLARLDQLPAEVQLTVKVAAVVGRSFLLRTLESIHPGRIESADLRKHLAHTASRRLTVLETEDPEPAFAFQHAVTQQVAYD